MRLINIAMEWELIYLIELYWEFLMKFILVWFLSKVKIF